MSQEKNTNILQLIQQASSTANMNILCATTELHSPKTNKVKKQNPMHFVMFKNDNIMIQFNNNFQATKESDGSLLLALKLEFQQKIFLSCESQNEVRVVLQVAAQQNEAAVVAFDKTIVLREHVAFCVFSIAEEQQFVDKLFALQLLTSSHELLGAIPNIRLMNQHVYNALKRNSK